MGMRTVARKLRWGTFFALALVVNAGLLAGSAPAEAAPGSTYAVQALQVAMQQRGAPYVYGAAGPRQFDCSGLVLYAYRKVGKELPRTAQQQSRAAHRVARGSRKPGDLVFFSNGGGVYHVGIYVGGGHLLHAPRTGSRVRVERIWTEAVVYGRIT